MPAVIQTPLFRIGAGVRDCLWRYVERKTGLAVPVAAPVMEIQGRTRRLDLASVALDGQARRLPNGAREHVLYGRVRGDAALTLEMRFRVAADNPMVRFQYILRASEPRELTKRSGRDNLSYFSLDLRQQAHVKEVRLSEFDESVHSFCLAERNVESRHFEDGSAVMGPILVAGDGRTTVLAAYEHGSQVPDAFVEYALTPNRRAVLRAVKGNYCRGDVVDADTPFETIWF